MVNAISDPQVGKKIRGNLAYQQRQQQRQNYLKKRHALRQTFEMGKLVENVGFEGEDITVICGILLEAKEKLQSKEAESIRKICRVKENTALTNKI